MKRLGWGSMLSIVDGELSLVPWGDLDALLLREIQEKSKVLTLDVVNQKPPRQTNREVPLGGGGMYSLDSPPSPKTQREVKGIACEEPIQDMVCNCGLQDPLNSISSSLEGDGMHQEFYIRGPPWNKRMYPPRMTTTRQSRSSL